jgi:phospholipase A1
MKCNRLAKGFWLVIVLCLLMAAMAPGVSAQPPEPAPAPEVGLSPPEPEDSAPAGSALEQRLRQEHQAKRSRFSLLPHKPNYLLPVTYNTSPGRGDVSSVGEELDPVEVKFQISLKTPILDDFIAGKGTLYVAYSQLAFWQAYKSQNSSPFREINFEPEIFIAYPTGYHLLGVSSQFVTLGFNHQSNGRSEPHSRSWNRIIANFVFQMGDVYVNFRPWVRIPESIETDDNPNMEKYYGYGELSALYARDNHTFNLLLRNNLRQDNKGALQLDWSFPVHGKVKGYLQFFTGYGESLIDYNHSNTRLGVGVMLSDWL